MPVPLRANNLIKVEAKYNVVTEFPNFDLHSAAAAGNIGLVEYALARGQPINSVLDGVLPLHAACAGGDEQVVKLLIEHGADVNAPRLPRRYSNDKNRDASAPIVGTSGSTPLHFAAANGNKAVISTLLLRGAHANRSDKHGVTPEMLARQNGWLECAELLKSWVENKDRDLRERAAPVGIDGVGTAAANRPRNGSFGAELDALGHSTRRRIQVKRSIDTALNMFKASSTGLSEAYHKSHGSSSNNLPASSLTPPSSPIRAGASPTPLSDDGRFSPSPSPIDPGSRRPSLPYIYPSGGGTMPTPKTPPKTSSSRSKRPRSAGTDAEQASERQVSSFGRGGAGRLGTKYSLMNLFKRGQSSEASGLSLQRTSSHQGSPSISPIAMASTSNLPSSFLTASPKSIPVPLEQSSIDVPVSSSSPSNGSSFSLSGFRFRLGSDASSRVRSTSQSQPKASSDAAGFPERPQSPPLPLAVDLHNVLARHRSQSRDRVGASTSVTRFENPVGLGVSLEEGNGSISRLGILRAAQAQGHSRNRSGSGGSMNRFATVFDDDMVVPGLGQGRSVPSRPGILRAHNRSTSGQSQTRALRFDSSSSNVSNRREKEVEVPSLRGSTSASSLVPVQEGRRDSPGPKARSPRSRTTSPQGRPPESAPASMADFVDITIPIPQEGGVTLDKDVGDMEEEEAMEDEYRYGRPLATSNSPSSKPESRPDVRTRGRGLSIASSDSSYSPAISNTDAPTTTLSSTVRAEFPFSINRPPVMGLEDSDESGTRLDVPSPSGDSRSRGDSLSSMSTTESRRDPNLSASATTSGSGDSGTVTTPFLSPEPDMFVEISSDSQMGDLQEDASRPAMEYLSPPLNERRSQSPLDIDMSSISCHAQAEALVQRAQQDILNMANTDVPPHSPRSDAGRTPLSARLAAYGESLELERKLREKKARDPGLTVSVEGPMSPTEPQSGSPRNADIFWSGTPSPRTPSTAMNRQHSLRESTSVTRLKHPFKQPKRPHTADTPSPTGLLTLPKSTHHPSRSASAIEGHSPNLDAELQTPVIHQSSWQPTPTLRHQLPPRACTPDPEPGHLSRTSSLEAMDTDTDLGPSLFRISTAPMGQSATGRGKRDQNRTMASATKLTKMGFSPNTDVVARTPKRFGGLRSFVQSLKGKP